MYVDGEGRLPLVGFSDELAYLRQAGLEADVFSAVRAAAIGAKSASPREALLLISGRLTELAEECTLETEVPRTPRLSASAERGAPSDGKGLSHADSGKAQHASGGDGGGHAVPGGGSGTSVGAMVLERTGWLAFFLCGLLLCERVMHAFEALLHNELELAFFVPLIIGHGGNSGGQAVSTVIRAIGRRKPTPSEAVRTVCREALAGFIQSVLLGLAVGPGLHYGMGTSRDVSAVVALTLPMLGLFANGMGALLPYLVSWGGLDPAVIVGPLMTTLVDTIGLAIYLSCATVRLRKK